MGTELSQIPPQEIAGEKITSGTVADARIAATISRDSELATHAATPHGASALAGDLLIGASLADAAFNDLSYTVKKQLTLAGGGGTLRIVFELRNASGAYTQYGKIYRNGGAVGTERSTQSLTDVSYSEDIAGWAVGDLIQIYCKSGTTGFAGYVSDLKIYASPFAAT